MLIPLSHTYNNIYSHMSADGYLYVVALVYPDNKYPGKNTDNIFETIVLRTKDFQSYERIPLEDSPKGQFNVSIEPNGMFLTYDVSGKQARRIQVPGFINPNAQGNITVALPPTVQTIVDPALVARVDALTKRVDEIASKMNNVPQSTVSDQHIADIAWAKANDAIYAQLQNPNSPLLSTIWQKAKDAAYGLLRDYGLIK